MASWKRIMKLRIAKARRRAAQGKASKGEMRLLISYQFTGFLCYTPRKCIYLGDLDENNQEFSK